MAPSGEISEGPRPANWIILRTSPRSTLKLSKTLTEDGFEAWTPAETRVMRIPRANVKRKVTLALIPGYVFVPAIHLVALLDMSRLPHRPRRGEGGQEPAHESFSLMHHCGEIPVVPDAALERLREAEADANARANCARFVQGQRVQVIGGSFGGMDGTVKKSGAKDVQVWLTLFGRHMRVKIPALLLRAK